MKNRVSSFLIKLNLSVLLCMVICISGYVLSSFLLEEWLPTLADLSMAFLLWVLTIYVIRFLESKILSSIDNSQNCDVIAKVYMSPFNPRLGYDFGALICGDYQKIINYYSKRLKVPLICKRKKLSYLSILALAYFQIDDIENASKIRDIIESMNPSELYMNMKTVENIRLYRDGRYSEFVERSLKGLPQYKKGKINYAFKLFYIGKGYYKMSDMEKAKECFEEVLTLMPKAGCSELARRYLEDINNETEHNLQFERLTPDPDYKLPKAQTWYFLGMHLLCFILSFLICACVLL